MFGVYFSFEVCNAGVPKVGQTTSNQWIFGSVDMAFKCERTVGVTGIINWIEKVCLHTVFRQSYLST